MRFLKENYQLKKRSIFNDVFKKSDYWVESLEILKLLTKGQDADIALAQIALDDKGRSIHVRQHALEVLIDQKKRFFLF